MQFPTLQSRIANRRSWIFGFLALVLLVSPALLIGQDQDSEFRRNRERWENMTEEERAVIRERFEEWRKKTPEQRQELEDRARNLRHLERGLRDAPPPELQERLKRHSRENEREREVRSYIKGHSEQLGSSIKDKLPPELLARVEKASPEERGMILRRYFSECGRRGDGPWEGRMIEVLCGSLELPAEEKQRLLALPSDMQKEAVYELKRRWIRKAVAEKGLPPGLSAEEWEKMDKLPDREFFHRMRGFDRMPEQFRGPMRRGWGRGRGGPGGHGDRRFGEEAERGDAPGRGETKPGEDPRRRGEWRGERGGPGARGDRGRADDPTGGPEQRRAEQGLDGKREPPPEKNSGAEGRRRR